MSSSICLSPATVPLCLTCSFYSGGPSLTFSSSYQICAFPSGHSSSILPSVYSILMLLFPQVEISHSFVINPLIREEIKTMNLLTSLHESVGLLCVVIYNLLNFCTCSWKFFMKEWMKEWPLIFLPVLNISVVQSWSTQSLPPTSSLANVLLKFTYRNVS